MQDVTLHRTSGNADFIQTHTYKNIEGLSAANRFAFAHLGAHSNFDRGLSWRPDWPKRAERPI